MLPGITSTAEEQLIQVALMDEQGRASQNEFMSVLPKAHSSTGCVQPVAANTERLASHSDACGIPMLYVRV